MRNSCKLTMIVSVAALTFMNAQPGHAAPSAAALQPLLAKQEFDGWWAFKTTVNPPPGVPSSQDLPALPLDLDGSADGNTMMGRVLLIYQSQPNGGRLAGNYHNVREHSKNDDDDEEKEQAGTVNGVVRNRKVADDNKAESEPGGGTVEDLAAAAAAELKKRERDVTFVVVVDIPDEDEDIVMRYQGAQLGRDMKGTVELGKRNKDGKFEKAGDGTFVARKMN